MNHFIPSFSIMSMNKYLMYLMNISTIYNSNKNRNREYQSIVYVILVI